MAKREFRGKPLDLTEQYITERSVTGETVAGTTDDDMHDEETVAIPTFVNVDDYKDRELKLLEKKLLHSGLYLEEFAEETGWDMTTVSSFLAQFRRDHEQELLEKGIWQKFAFPNSRRPQQDEPSGGDEDSTKESVIQYFIEDIDAEPAKVRDELDIDWSDNKISGVKGGNIDRIRATRSQDNNGQPSNADKNGHDVDESTDGQDATIEVTVEVGIDELFEAITSGSIPRSLRKQLFRAAAADRQRPS